MAKEWAIPFYKSRAWIITREGYLISIDGLCERCLKKGKMVPAVIVHHKKYLTPDNINDPEITLNWDNLEGLCLECHNEEHEVGSSGQVINDGLAFDIDGNVIQIKSD